MTITVVPALNDLGRLRRTHYQSTCWRCEALDGTVIRVTDCFEELEIQESDDLGTLFKYSPVGGFDATAQQRLLEVGANNAELVGIVVATVFNISDMAKAKWVGAKIDAFRVDYRIPFLGYKQHKRYFVREITYDGAEFQYEITTIEGFLFGNIGERWGPR